MARNIIKKVTVSGAIGGGAVDLAKIANAMEAHSDGYQLVSITPDEGGYIMHFRSSTATNPESDETYAVQQKIIEP